MAGAKALTVANTSSGSRSWVLEGREKLQRTDWDLGVAEKVVEVRTQIGLTGGW